MWLLRFFGWATLLAPPFYLAMPYYQRMLVQAAEWMLFQVGIKVAIRHLQLYEPFNLGIFTAMCLASTRAPLTTRVRALIVGMPTLAVLGLLLLVAVIGIYGTLRVQPPALQALILKVVSASFEAIPWVSTPLLWILLLGSWELRVGAPTPHSR